MNKRKFTYLIHDEIENQSNILFLKYRHYGPKYYYDLLISKIIEKIKLLK